MAKIRVHELAKELGIQSKEMVDILHQMGVNVKNHMSTMEDTQAEWVTKRINEKQNKGISNVDRSVRTSSNTAHASGPTKKPQPEPKKTPSNLNQTTNKQEQRNKNIPGPAGNRTSEPVHHTPRIDPRESKQPGNEVKHIENQKTIDNNRSHSNVPRNNRQDNNRPTHVRPDSNRPSSSRPDHNRPSSPRPENNRPSSSRPENNRPSSPRPENNRPSSTRPVNNRPSSTRPENNRPSSTRPDSNRGPGSRPVNNADGFPANKSSKSGRVMADDNGNGLSNSKGAKAGQKGNRFSAANKGSKAGAQPPRKDYSRPQKKSKHKRKKDDAVLVTPDVIVVEDTITVRDLADKLHKGSAEIVKKLMELGTMATINQLIDFETAEILASFYEVRVEHEVKEEQKILEEIVDDEESLISRPPVVTVMGHVDHGKTSLLDRIRQADVASGEAGGITQHIGAYQVKVNDNKITFIDTPGHEAFTAMRARGANLTDIVILVVAADDGVMPQTVEAINHIKAAEVPFIVALNKMDKPDANPEKVMQQLTEYNIVAEEWGGDTIFVPVSAKSGLGIDTLLEMVLLVAEMHEIKSNPDRLAEGIVIEGELDKGRGAVGTVLVLKGTLHVGDTLICGNDICKVRAMTDYRGRRVDRALPSMPVEITGWSEVPEAGGRVQACDERVAKEIINLRLSEKKMEEQKQSSRVSLDDFFKQIQDHDLKELNLIIKGDVQGSIEALSQSLLRLSTDEVKINVIHSAVGAISESDVMLASASNGIIIGFNVRPDNKARKYAEDENIDVRLYRVIYETIDDVKKAMVGLLDPEYKEKFMGRASVRATFKVPNIGVIAGSYVTDGKIQRNASVRVLRDGVIIYEGTLGSLKRFKDDVKEVLENFECGIGIKDFNDIKEGDVIEAFTMEEVPREL